MKLLLRAFRAPVVVAAASASLLVACEESHIPDSPDAAAILAEGTGGQEEEYLMSEFALWRETLPEEAFLLEFEGYANPAEGIVEIRMLEPDEWILLDPERELPHRTIQQGLNDYCHSLVTRGVRETVKMDTVSGSIAYDDSCPLFDDPAPPLPSTYSAANRAFCYEVEITSFYTDPILDVYMEFVQISPPEFSLYTAIFKDTFGLGNGAYPPADAGRLGPTDANGGLVSFGNFSRGDRNRQWVVHQRPSDADFFFNGVVPYLRHEQPNGEDDDCDGLIDEDTGSFPDGEPCESHVDCSGGVCDCSGGPCGVGDVGSCRTAVCGDGVIEGIEVCDDGIDSTICDSDCSGVVCGDGYTNAVAGELCDPGAVGTYTATCNIDCTIPVCGDGLGNLPAGEECDDGDLDDDDHCKNDCTLAFCGDFVTRVDIGFGSIGYEECDLGSALNGPFGDCPYCEIATCGDGYVRGTTSDPLDPDYEECDGNSLGIGGVTSTCDQDCTFPVCGDGLLNELAGEACDDGIASATCDVDCSSPLCGDGITNPFFTPDGGRGVEQCDNGLANSDIAACTSDCRDAFCGDAFRRLDIADPLDPNYEECDLGDGVNSDSAADTCRTNCMNPFCGDGVIDTGESCDDGAANDDFAADACRTNCALAGCGDGAVDAGEDCDLGAGNSDDAPDTCRTTCVNPYCGDGTTDPGIGEGCDDGNNDDYDACLGDCSADNVCGDGIVNLLAEACDDNNAVDGDGCTSCGIDAGWTCEPLGGACTPICGDGLLVGSEACDDDNLLDGDGCSATCSVEPGWTCPTDLSGCYTTCNDGIVAGPEECDADLPGDPLPTATCDVDCSDALCGDDHINLEAGEQCDDQNTSNNDDCLNDCTANTCGDGWTLATVTDPNFEECDGNGTGDGTETASCDADCTFQSCGDGYHNTASSEECDPATGLGTAPDQCRPGCLLPDCGDNVVDTGEECDFNNNDLIADRCRTDCTFPVCGDGVWDPGFGEACDGTDGIGPGQLCEGCVVDADGDGWLVSEGDCDDGNSGVNPGIADTDMFDGIDQNCDGFPGDVDDTTTLMVHADCALSPFADVGRCYSGTTGLQAAIDAASTGDNVIVVDSITTANPAEATAGVNIIGGFTVIACPAGVTAAVCYGWSSSNRSLVQFNTSSGSQSFYTALYGGALTSTTEIAYLDVFTNSDSDGSSVYSVHGASFGNSDGLNLHDNTIRAGSGFNGANSDQGAVAWDPAVDDCANPGVNCTPSGNTGQGNGWEVYCPDDHDAFFVKTNSALRGGGGGGASIALMMARSSGATVQNNVLTAGNGGAGGTAVDATSGASDGASRGGQGGPSVSAWFFEMSFASWSYSDAAGSDPVDCTSGSLGNTLNFGSAGNGGSGSRGYQAGRPGFAGGCHLQDNIYEWFFDCHGQGNTNVVSGADPLLRVFPTFVSVSDPSKCDPLATAGWFP